MAPPDTICAITLYPAKQRSRHTEKKVKQRKTVALLSVLGAGSRGCIFCDFISSTRRTVTSPANTVADTLLSHAHSLKRKRISSPTRECNSFPKASLDEPNRPFSASNGGGNSPTKQRDNCLFAWGISVTVPEFTIDPEMA
jgi:hypothetical protein